MEKVHHLSLVSTQVADRILENINAADWIACAKCGQEYRPVVIVDGLCDLCRDEAQRITARLSEIFKERALLIEMSSARFDVTNDNQRAFIAARDFNSDTENLYLCGPAGTGKTMLATKVIRQAVVKKQACAFRITEEWLRSLYGATGQDQQQAINRLVASRVLVFDEVGFEPNTEFSARALYDVINSRMLAGRNGLVVTSNLGLEELCGRLQDDRIPSRLGGICKVIQIVGRDWRQPL